MNSHSVATFAMKVALWMTPEGGSMLCWSITVISTHAPRSSCAAMMRATSAVSSGVSAGGSARSNSSAGVASSRSYSARIAAWRLSRRKP